MSAITATIPGPRRQPLVGNLLQIPRAGLAQHLLALSRDFDGIFQLDFGGIRVPFVYSADLVAELSDEQRFRKVIRPPLSVLRRVVGDGLFTAHTDSEPWGKAHRILMPAFTPRAMKGYFDVMLDVAEQLAARWERDQGADIPVADHMTRLTLDTISLAGFGYRFDSFRGDTLHPFLNAMVNVLSETMVKMTRLPLVNRLAGESAGFQHDLDTMNALVDEVIRQRRAQPSGESDLLNLMLEAVDPQTGQPLDETNIRHQVITFLVAGHETTSGLLTFALYMLLRNPHTLARAYAEVDRVLPGDTRPEFAHLARLEVLERVLKETLRLWPTAPAFNVAPYEDTVIGGRYAIARDQVVSVAIPALHRDPAVWADPDVFDIDRFLPENEAALHPHGYKPFGNGQRACIGRQFALTEAKLALAVILQRFALSDPYDYRLQIKETLTLKPEGFRVRARRRRPEERLLAGVSDGAKGQAASAPRRDIAGAGRSMLVLHGSSLGTSRDVAGQIADEAGAAGFRVERAALDERIDTLPETGIVVVVTATYNGRAPDSAKRAEQLLDADALAGLERPGLSFAVFGCGDSQWPDFQAFPARVDETLARTGAIPLLERGAGDASGDFDGAVETWISELWSALDTEQQSVQPAVAVTHVPPEEVRASVLPGDAGALEVLANHELVRDPTGLWDFALEPPRTSTRRLVLALPEGVSYRTGDHLGVYPSNRPELVDAVARRLGLATDDAVMLTGEAARAQGLPLERPLSVGRLLGDFVELQQPARRRDVRRLAEDCPCPHTRAQLETLLEDDAAFRAQVRERELSVFELMLDYPALQPPLALFLDLCGPLRPRYYSISSAAEAQPDALELTVGTVQAPARSGHGVFRGVASAFVEQLRPGDTILGVVRRPDPPFAPPADATQPMILIGPGTGIAPFRGFIQSRARRRAQGEAVGRTLLFQGSRHPEHDWLYAEELQEWAREGVVELHAAFSSDARASYRYVQDALWAERETVWRLLSDGATVYVCGDGRHMAPAVRTCLQRIHAELEGVGPDVAGHWLEALTARGQYRQDLFTT
ncbi:cytochrome P450 [Ectothiorhodospiraceae bacterium WFHF3C12]|nr:cytochrome P450 [Ectothiorhodospiraceae bacterium WFHF3C12]